MIDKNQKNQKKFRKNLIPILTGTVIFVFTFTIFRSTLVNAAKLRLKNNRQKKNLAVLERKSQLLRSLDKKEVGKRVQKLEEVFPSEKPVLNLIASLIQLAQEEGVAFSGVELRPGKIKQPEKKKKKEEKEESKEELQEFAIDFNINGELANITSFISGLEKTAPLMKIVDIGLSLKGSNASLGVYVYYQAFPEFIGSIDNPVPLLSEKEQTVLEEITDYRRIEVIQAAAPVGKENLFTFP